MFNWLSRFTHRFGAQQQLRPNAPHIQPLAQRSAYHWPDLGGIQAQAQIYSKSPWVYVAVNRIAEAASLVPLHVYQHSTDGLMKIEGHPLERLLDAPNPFISRFELLEQTLGMLELTGNAYWFLVGDDSGAPVEIWPLRPDRMSVVPDEQRYIKGYIYEIGGQQIPMEVLEVVHFKRWHPTNDYYGLSALQAARLSITTDDAMAEWNRNSFGQNNGVPAGIVTIRDNISDGDFERIKREWRASYGGPQRRTAFLRGGTIDWQDIGLSHTDLDFLKGRQANRDQILNIFGIPVGLVSDNATEANAKVAERSFIERTLWPKLVRLSQKITQELLPFWPGDLVAQFEDIRPTDAKARLDEIRTAYRVLSINELRERYYHLPPVAWGDNPVGAPLRTEPETANPADEADEAAQPSTKADPVNAQEELQQWERFAVKRLGRTSRPFESQRIPEEIAFEIDTALLTAGTKDETRLIFQQAATLLEQGVVEG